MFKKSLLVIVVMVSGILGCCEDPVHYWSIDNFIIQFQNENETVDEGTFDQDTLQLFLDIEISYLSKIDYNNPFINIALATSCESAGYRGLKDHLTNINISSNKDFNSFTAGTSLNEIIKIYSVSDIDNLLNEFSNYYPEHRLPITITEKPTNNTTHQFTISMDFESGKNVVATSKEITWN